MDNIHVTSEVGEAADDGSAAAAAVPSSPLADLRRIREQKLSELFKDFRVPRWEGDGVPEMWVRYRPIEAGFADKAFQRRKKSNPRPDNWQLLYNCDLLVSCCVKVFAMQDGVMVGEWAAFGPELAEDLGVPKGLATDVVRALYFTDGDVAATAAKVAEYSGLTMPGADNDFLGE